MALDAANDAICAASPVNNLDPRGIIRPVGPHCDIGAYEGTLREHLPADHNEIVPEPTAHDQVAAAGGAGD